MRKTTSVLTGALAALLGCKSAPPANEARLALEQKKIPFTEAEFATQVRELNLCVHCELFLDAGMSPNTKSPEGDPVISMIKHPLGQKFLESLIKAGADVNAPDANGNSPLMRHVPLPAFAQILVQNGANLNAQNGEGQSALHLATLGSYMDTVKILLKAGADPNLRDGLRQTPLLIAVQGGCCVTDLLKARADPNLANDDRYSPLMFAARSSNAGVVRALLKAGADPNFIGADGATAYTLAKGDITRSMLRGAGAADAPEPVDETDEP